MTIIRNVGPNVSSQFDELMTSQRTPVVELQSVYGLSALRDVVTVTGGGTVTNNTVEFNLSVSGAAGDSATLDSAERGRYMPGYAGQAGIGVRIPQEPGPDQLFRWGLFDNQNGAFFQLSETELAVVIRRAGVDTIIPQAAWNGDALDGSGNSTLTLEVENGNIFQINFTWYGYGVIEFNVVLEDPDTGAQQTITVHRFKPEGETSFVDPNLPLRGQVINDGASTPATMFVAGRQYSIIGKFNPEFRITSDRRIATVSTAGQPVIAFQRKPVFPAGSGRANSVRITLEGVDIITNQQAFFQVLVGGTLNTAFGNFPTANTSIPDDETALLVNNTATTLTGGEVVFQGVLAAGGPGGTRNLAQANLLDFELPDDDIVTLVVGGQTASANIVAVFRVNEEW
ncbi:hypothetical protein CR205_02975 [Alteribacter lacisalsi]|uniref:Uncharacterized protein n=1 Tax=Alteribacter lacisalsi TaxID=2045244 RepID=A0A2W0H6U4_9BACI|nr:hypothetical protein [Alteribacter lacisalsi]PYZ97574.1 hypothetical protein CR205_02975 [Alteribacter lacisalsi]